MLDEKPLDPVLHARAYRPKLMSHLDVKELTSPFPGEEGVDANRLKAHSVKAAASVRFARVEVSSF